MKRYIFPVILLALLTGCGKVKETPSDTSSIKVVSGTADVATTDASTTETETSTEEAAPEKPTTTTVAGDKISVTTTAVETTKKNSQVVTRAHGGSSGGVHGTTRAVPTAPRTTTTSSSTTTQQATTQAPTPDPKDYKSITFEFDEKNPNKLEVYRVYSDGKERSYQTLSVDTKEIQEMLEKEPSKDINDFIVRTDYDNDGYPDLFVVEKEDELNKTGRYFHYDPENGTYTAWTEMNALKLESKVDTATNQITVCDKKEDKIEYEEKTFEWNAQKQLVIRKYIHQYTTSDGVILIDHVNYDEEGVETSRETRDSGGNLIGGSVETTTSNNEEPSSTTNSSNLTGKSR